jgi:hypothetical protein
LDLGGELDARQIALAIDDLVIFSLNARRLIDDTDMRTLAQNVNVATFKIVQRPETWEFEKGEEKISVWRLVNIIVHHETLELLRSTFDLLLKVLPDPVEALLHDKRSVKYPAMLLVKSDQSSLLAIELGDFLTSFLEQVLSPIVDKCEDRHIYLERSLDDM